MLNQYITFRIQDDAYGLEIDLIKEIKRISTFTLVPDADDYICGLINLRGKIVTLINIYNLLGYPGKESGDRKKGWDIILKPLDEILEIEAMEYSFNIRSQDIIGFSVDTLGEIVSQAKTDIDPVPENIKTTIAELAKGVITKEDAIIVILDLDRIYKRLMGSNRQYQ